jgi:HemY protein
MRALLWLIAIFAFAAGLAMIAGLNDGYVLVVLPPWRVQLSLNFFLLLAIAGFLLAYFLLRLFSRTAGLPGRISSWRARRRREKESQALRDALLALFEGRFAQALKSAGAAFAAGDQPGAAALVAARAAHALNDDGRYRQWMENAAAQGEEVRVARLMTEAELALEGRRFAEAQERLAALEGAGTRPIAAQRLGVEVAAELGDWSELLRLVRQLRKHKAMAAEQAVPLMRRAHLGRLEALAADAAALATYWQDIPADELLDRDLVRRAAPILSAAGLGPLLRRPLEHLLDEEWDTTLAREYASCANDEDEAVTCLVRAEGWLQQHPRDGNLLFALGRLSMTAQLWGKAQGYLEASLGFLPAVETRLALAHLFEQIERPDEAQQQYRAAAELVASKPATALVPA